MKVWVKKMYKAIMFDLDGTLLDTREGVEYAVKKTISQLGLEMPSNEILHEYVGPPMQWSFLIHYKLKEKDALDAATLFRKIYKEQSLLKAKTYNRVYETLDKLKKAGIKICVATNKSHNNAVSVMEHFGILKYCDSMHGSDMAGVLKKVDIIRLCLKDIRLLESEVLYVGDSEFDYEGASRAQIDFLGVTYGFGFKRNEKYSFDVIDSISDLTHYVGIDVYKKDI